MWAVLFWVIRYGTCCHWKNGNVSSAVLSYPVRHLLSLKECKCDQCCSELSDTALVHWKNGNVTSSVLSYPVRHLLFTERMEMWPVPFSVFMYGTCRNSRLGYHSQYTDWLRFGRSGNRIPVGARFYAPVQTAYYIVVAVSFSRE